MSETPDKPGPEGVDRALNLPPDPELEARFWMLVEEIRVAEAAQARPSRR